MIYYTTDGTTPTTASTLYTGAITVNSSETILAIAVASGYSNSLVASASITIIQPQTAPPTFSISSGTYPSAQVVTILDGTPGAIIYYTTDGTTPTTASTLYTGPITVSSTETIEAIAVSSGLTNSVVVIETFNIGPSLFVPVHPCRIADTRNSSGAFGGGALGAGLTRTFPIPSSSCGIPSTAADYSLNVTVVPQGPLGYISIWPNGQAQPVVSTLNSLDGRVKASAAIVPAGANGAVNVYTTDATDVILDINGYFVSSSTSGALAFYPVAPCRVADTRNTSGPPLGGPYALVGGFTYAFPVLSSACGIPSSAQAYSLNFTAIPYGPLGYLSIWPAGQGQPLVSTLNAPTGTVTANAAIVPAGTSGAIDTYVTNITDLVIDINGYFAPPGMGGLSYYTLSPCRVLDTRQNAGPFTGTLNVNVTGSGCGVPTTAQAYVFIAAVVPPSPLGYLTLWPFGGVQPVVSTLNALDGALTSNIAVVPAASGSVSAYASNPTQLILDISGYFAP
jgi:hypothetical protein